MSVRSLAPPYAFFTPDQVTKILVSSCSFYFSHAFSLHHYPFPRLFHIPFLSKDLLQAFFLPFIFVFQVSFLSQFHYRTTMDAISNSASINCDLFVLIFELFRTLEIRNSFELNNVYLKEFLPCMFQRLCEHAASFASIGREKAIQRHDLEVNHSIFISLVPLSDMQGLIELGT